MVNFHVEAAEELETLKALATAFREAVPCNDVNNIQTFDYGLQKIYFDLGNYIKYDGFQSVLDECVIYRACTNSYYLAGTGVMPVIRIKNAGSFWRIENNDDLYILISNVFQNILKTDNDEIL